VALIAQADNPVTLHRPIAMAAFTADDDPVDVRQVDGAEIWRESDPARLNPAGRSRSSGVIVSFWFLATLLTLCAAGYDYWMATQGPQAPDLFEATFVGMWVNALHIMQSLLLLWIVGTIWVNQVERRSLALQPRKSIAVTRVPEFPGAANEGGLP